jgi:hypothetical protein
VKRKFYLRVLFNKTVPLFHYIVVLLALKDFVFNNTVGMSTINKKAVTLKKCFICSQGKNK